MARSFFTLSLLFAATALTACDDSRVFSMPATQMAPQAPQYGEAAVLTMLNDPATTFDVLDDEARLNRRAARSLIEHRNGRDGVYGSGDDNLFGSLGEVDAVLYVGPATLEQLINWAMDAGYGG